LINSTTFVIETKYQLMPNVEWFKRFILLLVKGVATIDHFIITL